MEALSLSDTSFRGSTHPQTAQRNQQAPHGGDDAPHQGSAIGPIACPPSQAQHGHLPPQQQIHRQGLAEQHMHAGTLSSDDGIQAFGTNSVMDANHHQLEHHPQQHLPHQQGMLHATSHAAPLAGIPEDMELTDDNTAPAGPVASSAIFGDLSHDQHQQQQLHDAPQGVDQPSHQGHYGHARFPRYNSDTALPQHHSHHQYHHRGGIEGCAHNARHAVAWDGQADASKHLNGPLLARLDSGLSSHTDEFHHNYQHHPDHHHHHHQDHHDHHQVDSHQDQYQDQYQDQQQQQQQQQYGHAIMAPEMHSVHPHHLMPGQAPRSAESTSDLEHDDEGAGGPQHLQPTPRDATIEGPEYIHPDTLAQLLTMQAEHVLLLDCRATLDFQLSRIYGAVPVWFSRLMLKRLKRKAGTISVADLPDAPAQALQKRHDPNVLTVIYDEDCLYSPTEDNAVSMLFHILRAENLQPVLVRGGFKAFRLTNPHLVVTRDEGYRPRGLQRILQPHDLSVHDTVLKIPASKIFSYLYVGNARQGRSSEFMAQHNITHVLNVSEEPCASNVFMRVQCMQVPLVDGPGHDLLSIIPQVIQFIEGARIGGGRVLVYCTNGLSRSVAILLAYMISTRKYNLSSAYRTVQTLRPNASPHVCFLTQLVEYEAIVKQASTRCKRRTRSANV